MCVYVSICWCVCVYMYIYVHKSNGKFPWFPRWQNCVAGVLLVFSPLELWYSIIKPHSSVTHWHFKLNFSDREEGSLIVWFVELFARIKILPSDSSVVGCYQKNLSTLWLGLWCFPPFGQHFRKLDANEVNKIYILVSLMQTVSLNKCSLFQRMGMQLTT